MIPSWNTTITDTGDQRWHFHYAGGTNVRIRPHTGDGDMNNWTNTISLDYYQLKPSDVTEQWLTERATEWVIDRDADVAAGNIT